MQEKVKKFNEDMPCHKKPMPVFARVLDIESEIGELAKESLKNSKYGTEGFVLNKDFEMEFGDVLYSLLSLANECNINAESCLDMALEKYENRIIKNKNMGNGK